MSHKENHAETHAENHKENHAENHKENHAEKSELHTHSPQVLAMAYVPRQRWGNVYKHESGFSRGTIFADLDKPWVGKRMGGGRK